MRVKCLAQATTQHDAARALKLSYELALETKEPIMNSSSVYFVYKRILLSRN